MPVDYRKSQQVDAFRTHLIKQGVKPEDADAWIAQKQSALPAESDTPISDRIPILGGATGLIEKPLRTILEAGRQVVNAPKYSQLLSQDPTHMSMEERLQLEELATPRFLSSKAAQRYSTPERGALEAAKNAAGVLSYAVPGGNTLKTLLTSGLTRGGLSALGASKSEDLGQVATDVGGAAATGAVLEPAVYGAGKGLQKIFSKVGPKLVNKSMDVEDAALAKTLGKPSKSQGGRGFLKELKKSNLDTSSPQKLLESSQSTIANEGSKIAILSEELTRQGRKVNAKPILDYLDDMIKKAPDDAARLPIQKVKQNVLSGIGESGKIDPNAFYTLKRLYGKRGNFKTFDPSLADEADVYTGLYGKMNDVYEEFLKSNGFGKFRDINNKVHIAIKAEQFAEDSMNKIPSGANISIKDILLGGGASVVTANPLPALLAVGGRNVVESGGGQQAIAKGMQKFGQGMTRLGESDILPNLGRILGAGSNITINSRAGVPQTQYQQVPPVQDLGASASLPTSNEPTMSKADLVNLISQDPKNQTKYVQLYNILNPGGGKGLAATQVKDRNKAITARRDLDRLAQIAEQSPQSIALSTLPGSLGAREYRSLWGSIIDIIGSSRTGAAYTPEQRKDYAYMLPAVGDSPEDIQAKIKRLREELDLYINPQVTAVDDILGAAQ